MTDPALDCLVIGGGPAGLTAAIYLARFHLAVAVIDAGNSRAALIPQSRNHAGFPDGIAGPDLLERMARQATQYGTRIERGVIERLSHAGDGFVADGGGRRWTARSVLLATGVVNRRPAMPDALHDEALASGRLRYCPICDGYEVTDTRVGVIGTGDHGVREAIFLRGYTADCTLIAPDARHRLDPDQRRALDMAGIVVIDGPASDFRLEEDGLSFDTASGRRMFASIYPALGSDIRSELAVSIGAEASDEGCLAVDPHQRTSVPGLYAAGDVVLGLDQISHAMGGGGVAATSIRNDLAEKRPLRR